MKAIYFTFQTRAANCCLLRHQSKNAKNESRAQNLTLAKGYLYHGQCDQKKIAKCLSKLPKNDFTTKMIDFNTFTKIA